MSCDDKELLGEFLREYRSLLDSLERELLESEMKSDKEINFKNCLSIIHTIKGTAACLGLKNIMDACHEYENIIEKGSAGYGAMLEKINLLREYCFEIENGEVGEPGGAMRISVDTKNINDCLKYGNKAAALGNTVLNLMEQCQSNISGQSTFIMMYAAMTDLEGVILKQQKRLADMNKVSMHVILQSLRRYIGDCLMANESKKVDVVVEGEGLMVDASLARVFGNTLVHLVGNSLEHGLESIDERYQMEKPVVGKMCIRCYEKEGRVIVEVEDDGRGLEREKIVSCAVSMGLHDAEKELSDEDLLRIVFESGLTTAERVTKYSGRGVGMSAVKNYVEKIGGCVEMESRYGEGCLVKMSIPLLAKFDVVGLMNVKILENSYSIRVEDVVEVIDYGKENCEDVVVYNLEGSFLLGYHQHLIPLVHLGSYFNMAINMVEYFSKIVVVKTELYFYGLLVDDVNKIEDLVVEKIVDEAYCSGAALTREGRANLVLDVDKIGEDCKMIEHKEVMEKEMKKKNGTCRDFLLFDIGKHKNYVVFLEDVYRIESIGTDQIDFSEGRARMSYQNKTVVLIWVEKALGLGSDMALGSRFLNVLVVREAGEYYGLVVGTVVQVKRTYWEVDESIRDRDGILGVVVFEDRIASLVNMKFLLEICSTSLRGQRLLVA